MVDMKYGYKQVSTTIPVPRSANPIRKSVYAHTEEEAQRLLYGLLADPGQAIKHVGDDCTLNEWLECWLRTYVADHVKQSTFTSYRTYIQKHFAPVLGQCKPKD